MGGESEGEVVGWSRRDETGGMRDKIEGALTRAAARSKMGVLRMRRRSREGPRMDEPTFRGGSREGGVGEVVLSHPFRSERVDTRRSQRTDQAIKRKQGQAVNLEDTSSVCRR